jgi:hypothetical protein
MTKEASNTTDCAMTRRMLPRAWVMGPGSWVVFLLCSCASKEKPKPDYASMKWEQRINQQIKNPFGISSPFQKQVFGATRSMKTSNFKAGEFRKPREFSGGDDKFDAGTFSQADKASNAADKTFSGADDQSKLGNGTFKTSQNRFDGQANSNAGKASPLADDVFKTGPNPAGAKAAAKSKRPMIYDTPEPSYSETELRRILSKDQ